jgi:FKBP-type peptidyl-prolyl cis-trans isomerase FklB
LQYRVLETGSGERVPTPDQTCEVSYVSRLVNGVLVRGVQFIEVTPVEEVDGMEEALMRMREGDRWELSIPAEMAFGKQGMGHIPPNAVLIVDLQLHEVVKWHTRLTREEVLLPFFAFVLFVVFYVSATREHAVSGQEVLLKGCRKGIGLEASPENVVTKVVAGSPAAAAGIRVGDVVRMVDGFRLQTRLGTEPLKVFLRPAETHILVVERPAVADPQTPSDGEPRSESQTSLPKNV